MSRDEAQARGREISRLAGNPGAGGQHWFEIRLAGLIVAYWRGGSVEADYKNLLVLAEEQRQQAMLRLCYGQLLLARRCENAWKYLDEGFRLSANMLQADEYFQVLKRHELLSGLPLSAEPSQPAPLDELLTEARVISRLRGRGTRPPPRSPKHRDTVD